MAGLDELRKALLSERETGRLLQIAPDYFDRAKINLQALREKVQSSEDPFSDDVQKMILETKSIEQTLVDLFAIRAGKILSLAEGRAQGLFIDREEVKRMIPAEREMFDRISESISTCREALVQVGSPLHIPVPAEPAGPSPAVPGPAGDPNEARGGQPGPLTAAPAYALVRVLSDLDPFMGVDGMTYALGKGDIVMLPERNAEVLVGRNIALNINVGK